jgi:hypothetical protein
MEGGCAAGGKGGHRPSIYDGAVYCPTFDPRDIVAGMKTSEPSRSIFTPPSSIETERCVTCNEPVTTKFCSNCGEMRASDRSHSVMTFMREHVLEAMLSLDGRLFRTAKTLLLKPGELTAAFMKGSRTPYLAPLQCFLLFNIVFFLTNQGVLDTPLRQHLDGMPWSSTARVLVAERMAKTHVTKTEFAAKFDAVESAQARSLVIAMVPAFAILIGVLTLGRKRPIVQHLVYSLHTYSFFFVGLPIVLIVVAIPIYTAMRAVNGPTTESDPVYTAVAVITLAVYIAFSSRRAYNLSRVHALIAGAVGAFGVAQIMILYRHLLFYVALRSM